MKRLRLVFALLAALLWLPLLGLVGFAVRSVEQEEAGRYNAVAERIFDEMERELTALLRREEERPPGDYALASDGAVRSPLRERPDEPFVVAYFEIGPDGGVRQPAWSADPAAVEQLLAAAALLPKPAGKPKPAAAPDPVQSPGSTLELKRKGEPAAKKYDVLSALNRALATREGSKPSKQRNTLDDAFGDVPGARGDDEPSGDAARAAGPAGEVRADGVAAHPQTGGLRSARPDARHLILVRGSERDGARVQQGFVIELHALVAWLGWRVLGGELRSAAHVRLLEDGGARWASASAPGERSYQHRFGRPFAAVAAVLALAPLPELEASGLFAGLGALLLLMAALALYAGYRMVAAVVGYAQRRSDFVSAVSHELKTPLTAIRMYGEMLRDDVVPDPAKRSRYYRIITAESERLTRLIDNVLELSKIERSERPLTLVQGDVAQVAREVLEVLEPHAQQQGFTLTLDAVPDLPQARFDRDALAQVLFNLIDNALKYAAEAQERTVCVRCEPASGATVVIRVRDRGPGVARQHLRRIFEPFYRGERELTRKHKGAGIGLSLVRGLVERMGGSVDGRNLEPGFEVRIVLRA